MKMHKDIINEGLKNNIIFYDQTSKASQFTVRLVSIAKIYLRRNSYQENIIQISVAPDDLIDFVKRVSVISSDLLYVNRDKEISVLGIPILTKYFDEDLEEFYLEAGGNFPSSKSKLAIALTNKGRVLLGAY